MKRVLLVVVTSDKGLCGAFNSNIIKKVESIVYGEYAELNSKGRIDIITIGKKGNDLLKKRGFRIVSNRSDLYEELNFDNASILASEIMENFLKNRFQKVLIVYNAFKNAAVQETLAEQFLPIEFDSSDEEPEGNYMYIFEPSKLEIVKELIPKSLKLQFYKSILESNTAEHGARMTAMHQATDNATELLKDLKLSYNKARQSAITTEILEISAGAEALNK
jgi:F-type H+-transporting ATPase subunit gamma